MTEQETADKTNYEYIQQPPEKDGAGSSGGRRWLIAAIVIVILITVLITIMIFANSETVEKAKNIAISDPGQGLLRAGGGRDPK